MLSRPCRKRRPSAREDGGVSGVSSSCGHQTDYGGHIPHFWKQCIEAFPAVHVQDSQPKLPPGWDEHGTTWRESIVPVTGFWLRRRPSGTEPLGQQAAEGPLPFLPSRFQSPQTTHTTTTGWNRQLPQNKRVSPAPRKTKQCRRSPEPGRGFKVPTGRPSGV